MEAKLALSEVNLEGRETVAKPQVRLVLSTRRIVKALSVATGVLLLIHLFTLWLVANDTSGSLFVKHMDQLFNFNNEENFPTFFSSSILLFAALLLLIISQLTKSRAEGRHKWFVLSMIFFFLAFDEAVEIHERLNDITYGFLGKDHQHWSWVVPYTILSAALGIYFFRFVMRLPVVIRNNFILSGFVYVFAAAGLEQIEGRLMKIFDPAVILPITTTLQELFEMVGVILFIFGLLTYISMKFETISCVTKKA